MVIWCPNEVKNKRNRLLPLFRMTYNKFSLLRGEEIKKRKKEGFLRAARAQFLIICPLDCKNNWEWLSDARMRSRTNTLGCYNVLSTSKSFFWGLHRVSFSKQKSQITLDPVFIGVLICEERHTSNTSNNSNKSGQRGTPPLPPSPINRSKESNLLGPFLLIVFLW